MSFVVSIAGTDRTSKIVVGSFRKRDVLNQQVDNCSFKTRRTGADTYAPAIGNAVIVTRNSAVIFGGVILRITENVEAAKIVEYEVECADYSQYLKRQLVTERYTNTTIAAIVADLVTNYTAATDGITRVSTTSTFPIESISFNRLSVADCLQKLADATSHVWYVDYAKDIHFFARNSEAAPFSLSDSSQNYIYDSLEITEDLTQICNSVLVQGGEVTSSTTRTEEFDGDGTIDVFRLGNKFASEPTVTVGGVAKTVGVEYLNDDASFDCLWNYNEKYIRFTAGHFPAAGTRNVDVTGYYKYPIVVKVPAPASQALFGTYEFAITDKSIASQDEAIARAIAELSNKSSQVYEGSFRTYTDGLRSGQILSINSTQRSKTIDVLIQAVTATMRDPLGDALEYTVRFATMKSIGIIEYLQNQIRSREVIVDDQETILNYIPLTDTAAASDSLGAPTHTSPPYVWDTPRWGYATWA
jgi:hypothetical protein